MGKVSSIPILGVALGAVMTLVVQSSSATIAVLQNFASQAGPDGVTSVIGLAGAIPILLGDNIGTTIIRGEDKKEGAICEPRYLDNKVLDQPVAAMYLVSQELENLAEIASEMLDGLKGSLSKGKISTTYEKFKEELETVHHLQEEITEYITRLFSSGNLTEQQSEQTAGLLYVTNNIQRIADRCKDIDEIWDQIEQRGMNISDAGNKELEHCVSITLELLNEAMAAVKEGSEEQAELVFKNKKKMHNAEKKFNKEHLKRVKNQQCDPGVMGNFSGILYNLERAADNCVSIAEEALDNPGFVELGENARAFAEAAEGGTNGAK